MVGIIGKTLLGLGLKLLSEKAIEDLLLWVLTKLAASTKTAVDDELLALVKQHLGK